MQETWRDRAKRAMKGRISQEKMAEALGTSQPGVSHWLNGRSEANLDDINRIADAIGVSRVWLTHGIGYEDGPGKRLLDLLISGVLTANDLEALAVTANALAQARAPRAAIETADFAPKVPGAAAVQDDIARIIDLPPWK